MAVMVRPAKTIGNTSLASQPRERSKSSPRWSAWWLRWNVEPAPLVGRQPTLRHAAEQRAGLGEPVLPPPDAQSLVPAPVALEPSQAGQRIVATERHRRQATGTECDHDAPRGPDGAVDQHEP